MRPASVSGSVRNVVVSWAALEGRRGRHPGRVETVEPVEDGRGDGVGDGVAVGVGAVAGELGPCEGAVGGGDATEVAEEETDAALGNFGVRVSDMFDEPLDEFFLGELGPLEGKLGAGRRKERHEDGGALRVDGREGVRGELRLAGTGRGVGEGA